MEFSGPGRSPLESEEIARRFANGFDDARDYFEWFMDPEKAKSYLAQVAA